MDPMETKLIGYVVEKGIARVTINRPEVRNALNSQAHAELRAAFQRFRDDNTARVAILTGAGTAFCAGQDLKEAALMAVAPGQIAPERPTPWGGITEDFECDKPIIAAVNGFALGGGTELALACDLIIASESAIFGLPEVRRGLIAGAGGLVRLPRQITLKQSMGIILTGRDVSATEALSLGFVNEVVSPGELRAAADRWAAAILECSPSSLRISMAIVRATRDLPEELAMQRQAPLSREVLRTADFAEGTSAFAEKRKPAWTA